MGLLDSLAGVLGGALTQPQSQGQDQAQGPGLSPLVTALIQMVASRPGGLAGLVQSFQQKGLGDVVSSWVGTGSNLPVSADQVQQALGGDFLSQLAGAAGISPEHAATQVAQALPHVVDHATPEGRLPEGGEDPFAGLLKSLGA